MTRIMLTLTGPSCAGKTFLREALFARSPDLFANLYSLTTRDRREGEIDGDEYIFVSEEQFQAELEAGELCQTVEFSGKRYETRVSTLTDIFDAGKVPIRVVEPSGVGQFRHICEELDAKVFSVFVTMPDEIIMERWLDRFANDTAPDMEFFAKRITNTFKKELSWIEEQPYNFYLDASKQDFHSQAYALSRIATGNIDLNMASRLSPYGAMAA